MKRISFWLLATVSVVVLLFGYDASRTGATSTLASPPAVVSNGAQSSTSGSGGSSGGSSSSGSASGGSSGGSSDGSSSSGSSSSGSKAAKSSTVTGGVADTQWGPVQVQLAVSAGKITKVRVLQQPAGNPKDVEINDYALPILIKETTDAQSAQIDMVSGATVTSTGYVQSLQSALDQAHL